MVVQREAGGGKTKPGVAWSKVALQCLASQPCDARRSVFKSAGTGLSEAVACRREPGDVLVAWALVVRTHARCARVASLHLGCLPASLVLGAVPLGLALRSELVFLSCPFRSRSRALTPHLRSLPRPGSAADDTWQGGSRGSHTRSMPDVTSLTPKAILSHSAVPTQCETQTLLCPHAPPCVFRAVSLSNLPLLCLAHALPCSRSAQPASCSALPFASARLIVLGKRLKRSAMPCSHVSRSHSSILCPAPTSITSFFSPVRSS